MKDYIGMLRKLPNLTCNAETAGNGEYHPYLYSSEEKWHVTWMNPDKTDAILDFTGSIPESAINRAYKYCIRKGYIKVVSFHEWSENYGKSLEKLIVYMKKIEFKMEELNKQITNE